MSAGSKQSIADVARESLNGNNWLEEFEKSALAGRRFAN
jgi:hypothetical protein